ncbi:MAG: ribbon-helix-helix domain-containing protein [Rhodospirillales bacterium]|jgi:predicted DNA-binding ribbon-helix-helix protein
MSPTTIRRHSVTLQGHRTSISLENAFWDRLRLIALRRGISINLLITEIDKTRDGNLSSALRVLALEDAIQESGKSMGLI